MIAGFLLSLSVVAPIATFESSRFSFLAPLFSEFLNSEHASFLLVFSTLVVVSTCYVLGHLSLDVASMPFLLVGWPLEESVKKHVLKRDGCGGLNLDEALRREMAVFGTAPGLHGRYVERYNFLFQFRRLQAGNFFLSALVVVAEICLLDGPTWRKCWLFVGAVFLASMAFSYEAIRTEWQQRCRIEVVGASSIASEDRSASQ